MAERILDRAFNRVYGTTQAKASRAAQQDESQKEEAVDEAVSEKEIKRMLSAWKEKDYFRLLELPRPTVDALNRPIWSCSSSDVSRAYRRLAVLVHPDKNPGPEARAAFEALNQAHRDLKNPSRLEEILKVAAERAREEASKKEARATVEERIQLNASKNVQARTLRKQEGKSLQEEILAQMRKRQMEMGRRQKAQTRQQQEDRAEVDEGDDTGVPPSTGRIDGYNSRDRHQKRDASDDDEGGVVKLKKRKKPTFM